MVIDKAEWLSIEPHGYDINRKYWLSIEQNIISITFVDPLASSIAPQVMRPYFGPNICTAKALTYFLTISLYLKSLTINITQLNLEHVNSYKIPTVKRARTRVRMIATRRTIAKIPTQRAVPTLRVAPPATSRRPEEARSWLRITSWWVEWHNRDNSWRNEELKWNWHWWSESQYVQSTCSCDYGAVNWKCGYPHHSGCKADKGNYSRDTDRDCRQVGGTEGDGGGETLLVLLWWHLHLRSGKHHVHLEANWRANRQPWIL